MPADLMRSFFPKICAYINTEKFFWCAFTVKNVCCTQYLDPIDELLTGKQYRLERLRRQKTKPERYLKQYHKGCNQQTLLYLAFLLCWLKEIYSSTFLRFAELMAQTISFNDFINSIFTIETLYRPEQKVHVWQQSLMQSMETLLTCKICINMETTDSEVYEL